MKAKVILGMLLLVGFSSCGNKEAEERAEKIKEESLSVPQTITNVAAIGKIEPEQGLVSISSEKGGIVLKVVKNAGDSVIKGDVILILKAGIENLNEDVIKSQILRQQLQADADFSNIAQYRIQLDEKNRELVVSERLVKSGAETVQNTDITRKDLQVLAANLSSAKKSAAASYAEIAVLQAQLKEAKSTTSEMTIRALQDGIITSMDAKIGTAISPLSTIATLAPAGKIVVHGEIDEMFASKVKLGNQVIVTVPGTNSTIAEGKITYLSPILADKSIFYELSGEQNDRRVRSFKVELLQTERLLINQKVQCDIKVD